MARERLSRVELRSLVKLAFNEYQYAHAATQVTEELRSLVDELESIAEARYRVGLAPQQDVIKAQTEHSSLQSELLTLERDRRGTAARLNGILARPANAPLATPAGWPALPAGAYPGGAAGEIMAAILKWPSSMHGFRKPGAPRSSRIETGFGYHRRHRRCADGQPRRRIRIDAGDERSTVGQAPRRQPARGRLNALCRRGAARSGQQSPRR